MVGQRAWQQAKAKESIADDNQSGTRPSGGFNWLDIFLFFVHSYDVV